jgi:hypothetical protein
MAMYNIKTPNEAIKRIAPVGVSAFVVLMLAGTFTLPAAFAAATFDPVTGTGFVGKGDVQLAFGWNNKQLQDNAAGVTFESESVTVSEQSWTCTKLDRDDNPTDQTSERERTTTTTTTGVVSKDLRERNQITGFTLTGYSGSPTITTSTEGPKLGTCPTGWVAGPVSEPVIVEETTTLYAVFNTQRVAL